MINFHIVGCVFQRTVKTIFEFLTNIFWGFKSLSAKLFFMPIFINGALKTANANDLRNFQYQKAKIRRKKDE